MKKLFFTLLTLCLCGATWAQDITDSNGCTYSSVTGDYSVTNPVELTDGMSATGAVEIPATVTDNGTTYTVVGIAMGAFGTYSSGNTSITSVSIPNTVTYLGYDEGSSTTGGSFNRCTNLASVTFAEGSQLVTIGSNAFYYCSGLTSIDIPSTVTTIASNAFYGCSILASINFPSESSLTTIGQSAFQNCSSLTEVKLPEGVSSLGNSEFYGCSKLETVWMPGSIQLQGNVFRGCTSLSAIVLEGEPGENGGVETGTDPFTDDGGDNITLYVETGLAPAYLASNWEQDVESETIATLSWNFNIYSEGISENAGDGTGTYYATYYTDAVGEFGDDVTPCIVTGEEEGSVIYSSISGYIPAETGVLLVASEPGTTYYYHPYETTIGEVTTANVSDNLLLGNLGTAQTTVAPNGGDADDYYFYKLSRNSSGTEGSVGFYWGADEGAPFSNPAGKAYLALEKTSVTSLSGISLKKDEGEDTTGISAVESASEKAVSGIYTIQGVRVSNMNQPGLYIVDGKKVLKR